MKEMILETAANERIAQGIFRLTLKGNDLPPVRPGQFVEISVPGFYLRRPISVFDSTDDSLILLYKVVGGGTGAMSDMGPGTKVNVLLPLGNGFDLSRVGADTLLVAGGIGLPPIYLLAKTLARDGRKRSVVLGFNTNSDVICVDEFRALGIEPLIATADGSVGVKGFVTDALGSIAHDDICACGPEPMLRALYDVCKTGQFSFEARMACGFGVCMGCTRETVGGYKRICRDGPILMREEIIWPV